MSLGLSMLLLLALVGLVIAQRETFEVPRRRQRPLFDRVLQPFLGEVGTLKFLENRVHDIGSNLNRKVDLIHDIDHGIFLCNLDQEARNGACFTEGKCLDLAGEPVGRCLAPTPKTTCCRFTRSCGESSSETVTYFVGSGDTFPAGSSSCSFVVESRVRTCQVRVDILQLRTENPDPNTGRCRELESHLRVTPPEGNLGVIGQDHRIFCGVNTGQHFYIPVSRGEQQIDFSVFDRSRSIGQFIIKVTQIDCQTSNFDMMALRAPEGCLQYFRGVRGPLATFNYDSQSPIAPGQDYSICFRSDASKCAVILETREFDLPASDACKNGNNAVDGKKMCCSDPDSYLFLGEGQNPSNGNFLGRDRYCGQNPFKASKNSVMTRRKPFQIVVHIGENVQTGTSPGFLMTYEALDFCPTFN